MGMGMWAWAHACEHGHVGKGIRVWAWAWACGCGHERAEDLLHDRVAPEVIAPLDELLVHPPILAIAVHDLRQVDAAGRVELRLLAWGRGSLVAAGGGGSGDGSAGGGGPEVGEAHDGLVACGRGKRGCGHGGSRGVAFLDHSKEIRAAAQVERVRFSRLPLACLVHKLA